MSVTEIIGLITASLAGAIGLITVLNEAIRASSLLANSLLELFKYGVKRKKRKPHVDDLAE